MSVLRFAVLLPLLCWAIGTSVAQQPDAGLPPLQVALEKAGDNAAELSAALERVPADQRKGMEFLIEHMPQRDLESLKADYLLENVDYAYRAWREAPWHESIPEEIFLNEILPYASINERRDRWRAEFYERFKPLVAEAKSAGHAAALLNQKIFPLLDVKFSRERPKADQSPMETIAAKKASCSGLSVLLVDACRAVGVPARFVGTPLWADGSGNHSWVEVWDGDWHFTGAAEPNGDNLDQAWFIGRAKGALAEDRLRSIYASSFAQTGTSFPLVWDRNITYVPAVNVTVRYAEEKTAPPTPTTSEQAHFDVEASMHALRQLEQYLKQASADRGPIQDELFARVPLTKADSQRAKELLWDDHVARIRAERAAEMESKVIELGDLKMPFFYSVTGEAPEGGRSLYISMHGGGGAPKRVNDGQWENQKRLYQVPEGVYLAPRAPTDTWNLWHQAHIDAMFDRLIEILIVFENVNPNRVYLMGYSAGGDGVYQLAPRMADRLAAASMMAGHPNEASPLGLRNLPFTIQVGGNDGAYNRNKIAQDWINQLDELRKNDPDGYEHWSKIYEGKGHWMDREDAVAIPWMAERTRNALPHRIVWRQDDVVHDRFYWLAVDKEGRQAGEVVRAEQDGQAIKLDVEGPSSVWVRLNDQLIDMDQPLTITWGDEQVFAGTVRRTIGMLVKSLAERGDPASIFSAQVEASIK